MFSSEIVDIFHVLYHFVSPLESYESITATTNMLGTLRIMLRLFMPNHIAFPFERNVASWVSTAEKFGTASFSRNTRIRKVWFNSLAKS